MKLFPVASSSADCAAAVLDVVPAVMRTIRCQMRGHSKAHLSIMHFRALAFLNRNPGAPLSDVAEHVGLTLPSASKLVQTLLVRGFITRQVGRVDRRKKVLAPTPKGVKTLEAARAATRSHLANELSKLPARQRATIVEAMGFLKEVFRCDPCSQGKRGGDASTR
ncbi:MAG TPA: MarR family winged helix-turn-helix transcriptional regulator [Tepidisphaeraceae bacterium]|nr:MarR family winged helix-turn-helix transcriptional regulator [Tepidisphaeraceae bacterium]